MSLTLKQSAKKDGAKATKVRPAKAKPSKAKKMSGKGKRFVLLIGDEGAILVYLEGTKVARRLFAPSPQPANVEAMLNLMQTNPNVPVSLLIDTIDQQYVRQSFPPVSSLSVNGLVKRRMDRDFRAEDLKGFLPVGRDKTGRKEWHFLLISLAKTPVLAEWIDLISELPNELRGIYLVPVEGTQYIDAIRRSFGREEAKPWQLLVTHNKVSGFRQVVTNNGKLVFTRVTQAIDEAIPAVIAGNIEQEIINTIEYLRRLGFQDAAGLDITVIASNDVNETIDLKRFNLGASLALSPLDVADALGFEQAALSADRFGDVVMATAFLCSNKKVLRFSTAYIDSLAKLYTARRAIHGFAVLLAVALVGLSVMNIVTVSTEQAATAEAKNKRRSLDAELQNVKKLVGGLNKNLSFKSAIVSVYDSYFKENMVPTEFLTELSHQLGPTQRVVSFDWTYAGKTDTPGTNPNDAKGPLTVKVEFEFKGVYADIDTLAKAEEAFIELLRSNMSNYTITPDVFPWLKGNNKSIEISFDQQQAGAGIKESDNRLMITFTGPRKNPAAGSAPNPGGMP